MNRKLFLKMSQYSQENTCVGITFFNKNAGLQTCSFIKETLTQEFSCEYWEILKNNYFEEHLWTAASESFPWMFSYMNK